jgi:hypothetical protein
LRGWEGEKVEKKIRAQVLRETVRSGERNVVRSRKVGGLL